MLLQQAVNIVDEPSLIAEFERATNILGEFFQKCRECGNLGFEIRRQLEQHRAKPMRGAKRIDRAKKYFREFGLFQAQQMRDAHVRLEREHESRGGRADPTLQSRRRWEAAERVVDLHRVQPAGVVFQEIFLGKLGRVKVRLPRRISETGSTGVERWHVPPMIRCYFRSRVPAARDTRRSRAPLPLEALRNVKSATRRNVFPSQSVDCTESRNDAG